jgi:hypothetical protein
MLDGHMKRKGVVTKPTLNKDQLHRAVLYFNRLLVGCALLILSGALGRLYLYLHPNANRSDGPILFLLLVLPMTFAGYCVYASFRMAHAVGHRLFWLSVYTAFFYIPNCILLLSTTFGTLSNSLWIAYNILFFAVAAWHYISVRRTDDFEYTFFCKAGTIRFALEYRPLPFKRPRWKAVADYLSEEVTRFLTTNHYSRLYRLLPQLEEQMRLHFELPYFSLTIRQMEMDDNKTGGAGGIHIAD